MYRTDAPIVEKPVEFSPRPSPSLARQLHAADLERAGAEDEENSEFKLPKMSSLVMVIMTNLLMQVSFLSFQPDKPVEFLPHQISFAIIIPSSSVYTERLGGGDTFSGLVIGVPIVISAVSLVPLMKCDRGADFFPPSCVRI